jgi:integrase
MPLKLIRRPWSPFIVMRGTVRGIRIEESTGTCDKKAAEEIRAKREAAVLAESIHGRSATATFNHAVVSYMENGGNKRFLEPIIKEIGSTRLVRLGQERIDQLARKLYPEVSDATRNRQVYTPVSAVMRHAAKRQWCAPPIFDRPPPSPERVRWLLFEEAQRLVGACNEHLRPLVIFLLYTGARVGEALWLDWRHVDLKRGHVTFPKTKNGEKRGVPLNAEVIAALANLPHREGEVFRRPDGSPYERPDIDDDVDTSAGTRIKTAFRGACRRAGITDFHPHDCRHTWATWHYVANRDLGALQKLGGWKSVRMVMRYAHVNVDELAHTIDRLPGGIGGGQQTEMGKTA